MKVANIMNSDVKTCGAGDSLHRAAQLMWENRCGAVPVVDAEFRPIGLVTDRDICMGAYTQGKPLRDISVATSMARRIVSCQADDEIESAIELMCKEGVRRLPVVNSRGTLAGILSLDDLACEAGKPLRGGVNYGFRDRVSDVLLAVCKGRVRARRTSAASNV